MARSEKTMPTVIEDESNQSGFEVDVKAFNQLATIEHEREATVRAIAAQIRYQLPSDVIDADLIQRDIAANMRRSVEACLEVGRGLAVLKAAVGHGNFIARLDVLGIETRVAQKFIQAASKFSNAALNGAFEKSIGNQTKLFEMLVLDDEQIEELELTGQTGELKLDDIATMSVKELRAALREVRAGETKALAKAKEEIEAKDQVLADKSDRINRLEVELAKAKRKPDDWHPRAFDIASHTTVYAANALQALDQLDELRETILNEDFGDLDKGQAIEAMAVVYFDAMDQVTARVAEVMFHCESVFVGYKDRARPMIDVFGKNAATQISEA